MSMAAMSKRFHEEGGGDLRSSGIAMMTAPIKCAIAIHGRPNSKVGKRMPRD